MSSIGILGAGTWGMALARHLAIAGHEVSVWSAIPGELDELARNRTQKNLPGMRIPDSIRFTPDLATLTTNKSCLVFAVPSVYVRQTAKAAAPYIPNDQLIVDVAKGIEPHTLSSLTEVIADELTRAHKTARLVALSGPTHAEEVALDMPTTIVAASPDIAAAQQVQDLFMSPLLRVYTNPDIRGVELCGALKNAIALAAGISRGMGYGDNARAAIICRGMEEIKRLGLARGCAERTFDGLAGIGDLVVTATSEHSRNNRCGELIGKGMAPKDAIAQVGMVVEGINVLPAALEMSETEGVEMPLVAAVDAVVNKGMAPAEAASLLMGRARKSETDAHEATADDVHPSEHDYLIH